MAVYFLDTSAIVKRYAVERGTDWVVELTDPKQGHLLFVVRITLAEYISAITRKERSRTIDPGDAVKALDDFNFDFAQHYFIIEVSPSLVVRR